MRMFKGKHKGFVWVILALFMLLGSLGTAGMLLADNDDHRGDGDRHHGGGDDDHGGGGQNQDGDIPPQTLPSGFESIRQLERDARLGARGERYSAWIVESSRFMDVPHRAFTPDVGDPATVNLPVNIGIIKSRSGEITLYDSGWKQLAYIYDWNSGCCWYGLRDQMMKIGLNPDHVVRIVVGHGHWDHAGQLSDFPHATLYIQKEELRQIDFFLDYPTKYNGGHIRAVNTVDPLTGKQVGPPEQACARTPVCGYPPQTISEIMGKVLHGKARIVDGRHEIEPGMIIHPAFRGHTYGSQLLQVNTAKGQLVFGSDTYSSFDGIKKWYAANVQQTDTIQQFLAYEKCYVLTSRQNSFHNCIAAHEPTSYSDAYPITANWSQIPNGNCSRMAELTLANGEKTHVPNPPLRGACTPEIPPHTVEK